MPDDDLVVRLDDIIRAIDAFRVEVRAALEALTPPPRRCGFFREEFVPGPIAGVLESRRTVQCMLAPMHPGDHQFPL